MAEWIWFNGKIKPLKEACVSIDDRGFQFADGVYEVVRFYNGRAFTLLKHLQRLEVSAQAIDIRLPIDRVKLSHEIEALIDKSELSDGMVYLQLTRGEQKRFHVYEDNLSPTLFFYVKPLKKPLPIDDRKGMQLLPMRDERWQRCYIKSIALLPNILAKNHAVRAGADEAAFVESDGTITEGSATNIYAVIDGVIRTHPIGNKVLPGITRDVLIDVAKKLKVKFDQTPFALADLSQIQEMFITASTREIDWVSHFNGLQLWQSPGKITTQLSNGLMEAIQKATAPQEKKAPRKLGRGCR